LALLRDCIAAAIAFIFVAVLIGFLMYNWAPANISGDSLDYTIGAVAASVAILAISSRFAYHAFLPWFADFCLEGGAIDLRQVFRSAAGRRNIKSPL